MAYTRETHSLLIDWDKDGTGTEYVSYLDGEGNGIDITNGASSADGSFSSASMTVRLRNVSGEFNRNNSSAGTYGLMNERVPIELKITHSAATTTRFKGFVNEVIGPVYEPVGKDSASYVDLRCSGLLATLAEDEVSVAGVTSVDIDSALTSVVTNLGLAAGDYSLADSDQVIPIYFETRRKVQEVFRDLLASEMGGGLYEACKDGKITFKARYQLLHGTADATWGDDNGGADKVFPDRIRTIVRNRLANIVDVETKKLVIGAGGTVIYNANLGPDPYGVPGVYNSVLIPANSSIGPEYIVPNQQGVAGGFTGVPTSTAYLDYEADSAADGSGSDQTANLTITFTDPTGTGAYYVTRTNTSASDIYQVKYLIRAVPIIDGSGSVPGVVSYSAPTGADDASVGTVAWTNPTNITSSNNVYATIALTAGQTSHYLTAKAWGAAIPSGATIQGVTVGIECKDAVQTTQAISARIIKAGTVLTTVTRTVVVGTAEAVKSVGGADDVWGTTLTPEDINDATFGFALYFNAALADTYSIDQVTMTVNYQTKVGVGTENKVYTAELAIPLTKGSRRESYSVPWVSDSVAARDYAQQLMRIGRYPEELLELTFLWKDNSTIDAMLAAELYHLIAYQDTSVGTSRGSYNDDWYRIIGIAQRNVVGSVAATTVLLKPSLNFRDLDHIAWDDFNRADNASSLGNTPTGKAWTIDVGGWQLLSNKARPTGAATNSCIFDLSVANVIAEVTLSNVLSDASAAVGLGLRVSDTNNYARVYLNTTNSTIVYSQTVAGATVTVATSAAFTVTDSVELRAVFQGNRLRAWANRKLMIDDSSSSSNNTNTKHGFRAVNTTTIDFDDVYIQGL